MLFTDPTLQELSRRSVAESRMLPFPVVKDLDVFKGDRFDLSVRSVANAMHPLVLEAVEPTLGWRVPMSRSVCGGQIRKDDWIEFSNNIAFQAALNFLI